MKRIKLIIVAGFLSLLFSSCVTHQYAMREPNAKVEFYANDFRISNQMKGEATVIKILWIDWIHWIGPKRTGETDKLPIPTIPVFGAKTSRGINYALYDIMRKNKEYDVVFYPQVEVNRFAPIFNSDIFSITEYTVKAKLGKLK